jgi:AcrR family transcriptional regulator
LNEPHREGPFAVARHPERARLREAVLELVDEHGVDGTTVEMVLERSGLDRAAFYRHFSDPLDCFVQIYIANMEEFDRVVYEAAERHGRWRDRLRAAAYASAWWIEEHPLQTRFDMVHMLCAGDIAQAYRDRHFERIVDLVDEGRSELDDPASMSREVAIGVFGSIYQSLLKQTHERREVRAVESFVPELMCIAVRPYMGHEAAMEELSIPPPIRPDTADVAQG